MKLIQELSLTIYRYTQDKSYHNQLLIIDLFSNLLKNTEFYAEMRSVLLGEVNNHMTGQASTFSELKKIRQTRAESNIMDLLKDTQKAIAGTFRDSIFSFPLLDLSRHQHYIIQNFDHNLSDYPCGLSTYQNSCVSINNDRTGPIGFTNTTRIPLLFDFDPANNQVAFAVV